MSTLIAIKNRLNGLVLMLVCSFAFADMALDEAKERGLVGEDSTGYLSAVANSPSREVRALIGTVNEKRLAEYERISQANNIPVKDVEKLAARKAFDKTLPGHFIRQPGSSWQKK